MRQIYSIANKYGGFVQIHAQMDSDFEKDILNLSAEFPSAITILSHCLSTDDADDLRVLFRQRNNIVCELSSGGSMHKQLSLGYKPSIGNVFSSNELKKDWKKLIEEYPNQVMIGSDNCCGLENQYDELIAELRGGVLQNLSPDLIEKVAYKNAVRIFKLKEN
jgi:predicted TIM-barrel fold metal-dependent hydrolase